MNSEGSARWIARKSIAQNLYFVNKLPNGIAFEWFWLRMVTFVGGVGYWGLPWLRGSQVLVLGVSEGDDGEAADADKRAVSEKSLRFDFGEGLFGGRFPNLAHVKEQFDQQKDFMSQQHGSGGRVTIKHAFDSTEFIFGMTPRVVGPG